MKLYHKQGCPICDVAIKKLKQANIKYEDVLVNPDDSDDENFQHLLSLSVKTFPVLEFEDGTILKGVEVSKWTKSQMEDK